MPDIPHKNTEKVKIKNVIWDLICMSEYNKTEGTLHDLSEKLALKFS